jgi:acetyl esterase/lipase
MKKTVDLAYGSDGMQKFDAYLPDAEAWNNHTLILVHGGGWWQGDKHKEDDLASQLVAAGYQVFAPNYRLVHDEQNLYPTQIDDVQSLTNYLVASADFDVAVDRLAFFGASSGGNIAIEAALRFKVPVVTWSALIDLAQFMTDHPNVVGKKLEIGADVKSSEIDQDGDNDAYYKWLVDNYTNHGAIAYSEATLLNRVTSEAAPMFLANSMHELVPKTEVIAMAKALTDHDVQYETLVLAGSRHGEGYLADALQPSLTFLARVLLQNN